MINNGRKAVAGPSCEVVVRHVAQAMGLGEPSIFLEPLCLPYVKLFDTVIVGLWS